MSGSSNLTAQIPVPTAPLVDDGGRISLPWRAWFLVLQRRTGGTVGVDSGAVVTDLASETTAREAADSTLQGHIDAEATARANADVAEASTRAAADTAEAHARVAGDEALTALINSMPGGVAAEANARQAADVTLQDNINSEASARAAGDTAGHFASLNLSGLPTTDPGGGRVWLKIGDLHVGP